MTDAITEAVVDQLRTRAEKVKTKYVKSKYVKSKYDKSKYDKSKYGTTMERNDLTLMQRLQHLQEELMDAAVYVEKLKGDIDKGG